MRAVFEESDSDSGPERFRYHVAPEGNPFSVAVTVWRAEGEIPTDWGVVHPQDRSAPPVSAHADSLNGVQELPPASSKASTQ